MVSVNFKKKSCNLVSVIMTGHAESVDAEYDMVCSAISAVSQTILIGILEVLKLKIDYSINDGFLNFSLEKLCLDDIEKCQVLMETMLLGLKSIEISFGEYININVEEV
ncbi:ribosomal-processing cysteine protease Prp [Clostridium sp. DJ247]|uniref:ribosomal-processing cysteine protease Prp n=1 Tax=Clostridium sp. DJ247 TaxID=2726188 RepID=UPI00162A3E8F|nr:ribosomal-processing cysteine protease Prp [Clostridium sp. DJ247]MBC2580635.1 ribosomal-processing cysteine protease Prp [Clostridium sp. DJ247]